MPVRDYMKVLEEKKSFLLSTNVDVQFQQKSGFGDFLSRCVDKNMVLLELGVGFNTPTIIRFPFEKLVREDKIIILIRLNLNEAAVPESFVDCFFTCLNLKYQ